MQNISIMKRTFFILNLLIACVFTMLANDSVTVSVTDLKALIQRVERLEQAQKSPNKVVVDAQPGATKHIPKDTSKIERPDTISPKMMTRRGKFTIGGYGEVTAKHCFYSNNYLRYGKNPEKYANDHYGEFDLPRVDRKSVV